jgi:hypothetical protein
MLAAIRERAFHGMGILRTYLSTDTALQKLRSLAR